MWSAPQLSESLSKPELYSTLGAQLQALIADEPDAIANMANCAALIYHALRDVNWAGFYLLKDDTLVLGPFQGQPACVRIPMGRGVCGTAADRRQTLLVPNVDEFPGHIACDSASRSEVVVPLMNSDGKLIGVLDIDSPSLSRFDQDDQRGIESLAAIIAPKL
jgi:GAF domain-containing protein